MMCENSSAAACPYDVGDILTTTNARNPTARWPGTEWTQITGRFLLGAGDKHAISSTGGSETHTLTQDELPELLHLTRCQAISMVSHIMTKANDKTKVVTR